MKIPSRNLQRALLVLTLITFTWLSLFTEPIIPLVGFTVLSSTYIFAGTLWAIYPVHFLRRQGIDVGGILTWSIVYLVVQLVNTMVIMNIPGAVMKYLTPSILIYILLFAPYLSLFQKGEIAEYSEIGFSWKSLISSFYYIELNFIFLSLFTYLLTKIFVTNSMDITNYFGNLDFYILLFFYVLWFLMIYLPISDSRNIPDYCVYDPDMFGNRDFIFIVISSAFVYAFVLFGQNILTLLTIGVSVFYMLLSEKIRGLFYPNHMILRSIFYSMVIVLGFCFFEKLSEI